jgi:hypothetical protein
MSDEIGILKEQLRLQILLDEYKDDLISIMKELLESKETLVGELRERINQLKLNEVARI